MKIKPLLGILSRGAHPLARGLAGAWLFNEGRGNTAWDLSGGGHAGVLTSMDPASDWVPGPHGHALDFDGTDDRVIVGPDPGISLGTANACIVRYKHRVLSTDILVGHKAFNDGGYFFYCEAGGSIKYCANGSYVGVTHGIGAGDEVWLGVSRQGTAVTFYKNGLQLGTVQTLGANNDLRISTIGSYWSGASTYSASMRCDYVYCWRRALSAGEMAWLYRDPFCFLRRPDQIPLAAFPGQVHNASGSADAMSSAGGIATLIPATWQPTGRPWPKATLGIDASWRKEAILNGMTDVAVKLGTVLTQGWFWARRVGCSAVYRGTDLADAQDGSLVCTAPADVRQIALPTYLLHETGSSHCYLLRRFNHCGQQDRTTGAAVRVRIGSDGRLALPTPNTVFGLNARRTVGNRVECTWFYWPLDQAAAPHVFNIYWDGGTGHLDFVNPIAVLPYEGRRYYRYQSGPLEDGRYIFTVRAESVTEVEGPSPATAECVIKTVTLGEPGILDVEAV